MPSSAKRLIRIPAAIAAAVAATASPALACPTCGIGDKLGIAGFIIYATFMAAPFAISYGVYKYIKKLPR